MRLMLVKVPVWQQNRLWTGDSNERDNNVDVVKIPRSGRQSVTGESDLQAVFDARPLSNTRDLVEELGAFRQDRSQ
ncbi:hypothetical protein KIN20_019393 [Parelaphostrongylus tenuis]|uniref:Uncharacterized protein n=1 Tax=Parelaphostrongylus tenuis TaxID=148309 RepID=A0AAD5MPH5_PARTN|nr:hypothetical protein KIN20_019393 [Parelaphostrongylus tenuis]